MSHRDTILHLCPNNERAHEALNHPDNRHFVSPSSDNNKIGLEIGFHVARVPGRVMARLGRARDADLVLPGRNISAIHVAFEIHPETHVVLLSVRSKHLYSVTVAPLPTGHAQPVAGDCVLVYCQEYEINISDYHFVLNWRLGGYEDLREIGCNELQRALQREQYAHSRDLPTKDDSTMHTWHNTRVHTVDRELFSEAPGAKRHQLGHGNFGSVFSAVDRKSGWRFAVKVIQLQGTEGQVEYARSAVHAEVKFLQKLKHPNIIELLGTAKWDTDTPEIIMPMRAGSVRHLADAKVRPFSVDILCSMVLEQILAALDYTASRNVCHRDVKPENILYYPTGRDQQYTLQLADFGLSRNETSALGFGGTLPYSAPELHDTSESDEMGDTGATDGRQGPPSQTPKMDVWSLFATTIDLHSHFEFPPRQPCSYRDIFRAIRAAAERMPRLAAMTRKDPRQRASAAQMLVALFDGRGLTTSRNRIASLEPANAPVLAPAHAPEPVVSPTFEPAPRYEPVPFSLPLHNSVPSIEMKSPYISPAATTAGPVPGYHFVADKPPVNTKPARLIMYPAKPRGRKGKSPAPGGTMAARAGITKPVGSPGDDARNKKKKRVRIQRQREETAAEPAKRVEGHS